MSAWEAFSFRFDSTTHGAATANQLIIAFDSTRGGHGMTWTPVAAGSSLLIPGPMRARYHEAVIRYSVLCTTQNLTLAERVLTGIAGTSADWETQGAAGAATITAGTTAVREFKPLTPDWQILLTCGSPPPGSYAIWGVAAFSPAYGG